MAERRMFAKAVIGSGKFLRMPATARLLYFDLGMEADDDGIVEAFRVMRTTGATDDDLKILCAKGFVRVLNDELVTVITDWKVNNFIRGDRYRPSVHADLLSGDTNGIPTVYQLDTNGIPDVSKMDTEVRSGKDRLVQSSIGESEESAASAAATSAKKGGKKFVPPTVEEVREYCTAQGYGTIDPEGFVDYYAANGWKVGNQAMKDWKATVRNWARRDKERGITTTAASKATNGNSSFDTGSFFEAALAKSYGEGFGFDMGGGT